jgi:hypothetical protein
VVSGYQGNRLGQFLHGMARVSCEGLPPSPVLAATNMSGSLQRSLFVLDGMSIKAAGLRSRSHHLVLG